MALVMYKELLATAAIMLTFAMYVPYVRSIYSGRTTPHAFTWVIWSLASVVVCLAQTAAGGGVGAWPTGLSGLTTGYIAVLAYRRRADTSITPTDWMFLCVAVAALSGWMVTSDPLIAVALLTAIEIIGFGPSFRLAYRRPHGERVWFFALGALRNVLAIGALERYSATTVLYPAAKIVACVALVTAVMYWRSRLRQQKECTRTV